MLTLTKMMRTHVIENVYPSDLDPKDVKRGLQIKEKMLLGLTDEYTKQVIPNAEEIERMYKKHDLQDYAEKVINGEMDLETIPRPGPCTCDLWFRYRECPFNIKTSHDPYKESLLRIDNYSDPFVPLNFGRWVKEDKNHIINIPTGTTLACALQLQIVIKGDNAFKYFPYASSRFYSGITDITDNLKINSLKIFFKNRVGDSGVSVDDIDSINTADVEWLNNVYGQENVDAGKVFGIQSDPFILRYKAEYMSYQESSQGGYVTIEKPNMGMITGRQWIKCGYIMDYMNLVLFSIKWDRTEI